MSSMSHDPSSQRLGRENHRLFGYFGIGGPAYAAAAATAQALTPAFEFVAPAHDTTGSALSGFGLASRGTPSIGHAGSPDGSFLMLDGRLLESREPLDHVLDDCLAEGISAFKKHRFQGFVAVWNADTSEAMLLRDPYGIAPGFIARIEHGAVFSTELSTLIRFGIDPAPNASAIDAFLTSGYFPAPLTPLSTVSKLPPGHLITITADGVSTPKPWFHYPRPESVSVKEATEMVGQRMHQALLRTWPDDGNAGLLLSGGVDSALILAGAQRMLKEPMRTFTFRYDDYDGQFNEGCNARAIAEHLGAPHEEIPIRPRDILDDLDRAVASYGEPFTWGLHSYQLGPLADRGITSVFSGAGADGWNLSKRHRAALKFYHLPSPVRASMRKTVRAARPLNLNRQDKAEWVTRPVSGLGDLYSPDDPRNRSLRRRLYQDPGLADRGARQLLGVFEEAASDFQSVDPERTLVLLDKRFNAAEQMLLWNRSWAHAFGLELCLPYYDRDLLDLAMNVEGNTTGKDLLRTLAGQYLPIGMAQAPKVPQQMPVSEWLRGPLSGPIRERLTDLPGTMSDIFNPTGVIQIVDEHVQGTADHGWRLIGLLTTAAWFRRMSN